MDPTLIAARQRALASLRPLVRGHGRRIGDPVVVAIAMPVMDGLEAGSHEESGTKAFTALVRRVPGLGLMPGAPA
jgi:hypothetical protein